MMKRKLLAVWVLTIAVCTIVTGCKTEEVVKNQYISHPYVNNIESGMDWPDGQILPTFATPAETVDAISISSFNGDEQLTMTVLQGIVNGTKPRLLLPENSDAWAKTEALGLNLQTYRRNQKYELVQKYMDDVSGVVLYDISHSVHYRNLASSIAAVEGLLPMETSVYEDWKNQGIEWEVKVDLTHLTYESENDIYNYLYDNYWEKAQHRLIVSLSPHDCQHVRDMAAATGAIVVWLDCTVPSQQATFEKFLADMTAGNGLVLGWFTTERSGITTVTKYGISTVPADLYSNSTIYAGTDHTIQIPAVPDKPELENKVYIAVFYSDGDNVQYVQHHLRSRWDQGEPYRGQYPINWTISPALVDIGPGLLNYYYTTATELDCFVAGPSGLGYAMPINLQGEAGAPVQNFLEDESKMAEYTKLTDRYLERSGLRIATIWDTLSESQRNIYASNTRYLWGLTVNGWFEEENGSNMAVSDKISIHRVNPWYGGDAGSLTKNWVAAIQNWDNNSPLFMASQISSWSSVTPERFVAIANEMKERFGDRIEFVRADHFCALYHEANGLPFDLTLSAKLSVSATSNNETVANTTDGTPVSLWEATESGTQTITYDLGGAYTLNRYVIRHAGANGLDSSLNTKNYTVEVSSDGAAWNTVDTYTENTDNVTDVEFEAVDASYLRITITDAGADSIARIADVELYGISLP